MIPIFLGNDYSIYLIPEKDEFHRLGKGEKLEAPLLIPLGKSDGPQLKLPFGHIDTGKTVIVHFGENTAPGGIDVIYLPEDADWYGARQISVTVNDSAYEHIQRQGSFGSRYGACADKITIINDNPDELFMRQISVP